MIFNTRLNASSFDPLIFIFSWKYKVGLVREIKLIVCIMTYNLFKMTYFDKWSDIIPAQGPQRSYIALIHFFVSLRDTNGR